LRSIAVAAAHMPFDECSGSIGEHAIFLSESKFNRTLILVAIVLLRLIEWYVVLSFIESNESGAAIF
jgi:hypothetical protein